MAVGMTQCLQVKAALQVHAERQAGLEQLPSALQVALYGRVHSI